MCGFSLINLGPPRDGLSGGALSSSKEAEFKCSIPTSQSKKKREIHRFFLYSVYLTYYHFDTYAICTFIRDVLLFFFHHCLPIWCAFSTRGDSQLGPTTFQGLSSPVCPKPRPPWVHGDLWMEGGGAELERSHPHKEGVPQQCHSEQKHSSRQT